MNIKLEFSRLKKEAIGLGESDVKESDIDYAIGENEIDVYLTNKEVAKHDGDWDDAKYYEGWDDAIAFIQWTIEDRGLGDQDISVIYVNFIEARPEYNQTKVSLFLMQKFMEVVVEPEVKKLGAKNVYLDADFANSKLGAMIKKYVKRKLDVNWVDEYYKRREQYNEENGIEDDEEYDEGTPEDFLRFLQNDVGIQNGRLNPSRDAIIIDNKEDIDRIVGIGTSYGVEDFGGSFDASGNISIAIALDDGSMFMNVIYPSNENTFLYRTYGEPSLNMNFKKEDLDRCGGKTAIENLSSTFGRNTTISFEGETESKTIKEIFDEYNNQQTASITKRLQRRG